MSAIFQIKPISLHEGFRLSCDGLPAKVTQHRRLVEAIVRAVQLGRDHTGEIQIFDCEGHMAEILPLTAEEQTEFDFGGGNAPALARCA